MLARAAKIVVAVALALVGFFVMIGGGIVWATERGAVAVVFSAGVVLIGAGLGYAAYRLVRWEISAARTALAEHQSELQKRHEEEQREEQRKGPRRATWLEIGLALLTALAAGVLWAPGVVQGQRSMKWPLVEAKVIDARMVERSGPRRTIRPAVTYTYTAGGRTYTSDQTSFRFFVIGAHAQVERTPKGAIVRVAVNPADAEQAVLEPGFSWIDVAVLVCAWLICIGFLLRHAVSQRRRADGR